MSNDAAPLQVRRERIRKTSRFLKILSLIGGVLMGACLLLTFLAPIIAIGPRYRPEPPRADLRPEPKASTARRMIVELAGRGPNFLFFTWDVAAGGTGIRKEREWLARGAAAAWCGYGLVGAGFFFTLFRGYERGSIFEIRSVRRLRRVGGWMIGIWGMGLAFQLSKAWWAIEPDIHFDMGAGLLPGCFICLVAWIMEEAHQIAEEQALTV